MLMEPKAGFEPATLALRMRCSTTELLRLKRVVERMDYIREPEFLSFAFFSLLEKVAREYGSASGSVSHAKAASP